MQKIVLSMESCYAFCRGAALITDIGNTTHWSPFCTGGRKRRTSGN